MYQYILVFLITTILMICSENKIGKTRYFYASLALIIISLFSGLRGIDVGTDTSSYYREFLRAQYRLGNFRALYRLDNIYNIEFSFELIAYLTAYLKNGFQVLLTIYSLITHLFIYLGIKNEYEQNKEQTMWMPWLIYCMLFYNCTLNNMRQWVGIAIIFFLYSDRKKLELKRVIVYTLLATFFHMSSILNIFIYTLYVFCNTEFKNAKIVRILSVIFLCSLPFLMPYMMSIFVSSYISISNNRYNGFILGGNANSGVLVDVVSLLIRVIFLFNLGCIYLNNRKEKEEICNKRFELYCMLIDTFFSLQYNQLNLRIGNYFSVLELHNVPIGMKLYYKNKASKLIGNILLIGLLMTYWLIKYMFWNHNETHPYGFYL